MLYYGVAKFSILFQNLETLRSASFELRNSEKLARILELVLAIGNYMNKGSARVGSAQGFRVGFLQQVTVKFVSAGDVTGFNDVIAFIFSSI